MSEIQKISSEFVNLFYQGAFTDKLDEKIFEAFLNENKGLKDKLREAVTFISGLKDDYVKFATVHIQRKGSPEKKLTKPAQIEGKSVSADASSGSSTKMSENDVKHQLESLLHEQAKHLRTSFVFSSMENISKNLSLFDDFFLKKKQELEHEKNMSMLSMIAGGIGFDQVGTTSLTAEQKATNSETQKAKRENAAKCLEELNRRWEEYHQWQGHGEGDTRH